MKKRNELYYRSLDSIWRAFIYRCANDKCPMYKDYGGRGISVCEEWLNSFESFYEWSLKSGWQKGLEIDRIDNNSGYSPLNCRYVNRKENCRNKRNNIIITYQGESLCVTEWAERTGIHIHTLFSRIKYKYPLERLFEPSNSKLLTINGKTQKISEWAKEKKLRYRTVLSRYNSGIRGDELFFKGKLPKYIF